MKRLSGLLCFFAVLAGLFAVQPFAQAQQPLAPTVVPTLTTPAPETPVSSPLAPLATQLGQTIKTLVDSASTSPAPASAEGGPGDIAEQITDTFATNFLGALAKTVDALKINSVALNIPASAFSDFGNWVDAQSKDPRSKALWDSLTADFLVIVVPPLLVGMALLLFFIPLRRKLKRKKQTLPERVGLLIGLFLLRLVPVLAFLGAALLLLEQNETHRLQRFVILNVLYALSLSYAIRQVLRGLFSPSTPFLRILPLSTPQAFSACRWLSTFSFVIVYGYFLIDVATALHVPASAILAFQNFFAIGLTGMAIAAIFQMRPFIASILRGKDEEGTPGFIHAMRLGLARRWHSLATVYLIISLIVILLDIDNSFALMLRGTILSVVILVAARLGFVAVEIWKTPKSGSAPHIHRQVLAFLLRPVLWLAAATGIAATWGVNIKGLLATPQGQRLWGAFLSIALTLLILTVLYEMLHGSIERHLTRRDKDGKAPVATARARTLLPMVRTAVFVLFSASALLICLSAVGLNIGPLLAGAGILGVALGFGSQTLVKDFLTGLFIVAENTIAVGDTVKIDDFNGTVETLSLRTLRLRDADGALHILPFSEVSKITNMSKGFAYALVDIGVAYDSDLERVMQIMREVGATLQEDPALKRLILEPIEVMGVESFEPSSIILRARIRTRPGKQANVRRALLLRIKQRFDKEHIEIPFQTVVHITKTEG